MDKEQRDKCMMAMILLLIGTIIFGGILWGKELSRISEINQYLNATACINDDCGSWCAVFPIECSFLKAEKSALQSINPFEFLIIIVICIEIVIVYYFTKTEKDVKENDKGI